MGGGDKMTYDLSTSSKWTNLSDGDHTVQIIAKADGYRDSEPSSAVTVTKGGAGHTVTVTSATAGTSSDDTDAYIAINRTATAADYDYHFVCNGSYTPSVTDKQGNAVTFPLTLTNVQTMSAYLASSASYTWFNMTALNLPQNGETTGTLTVAADITDMSWYGSYYD